MDQYDRQGRAVVIAFALIIGFAVIMVTVILLTYMR